MEFVTYASFLPQLERSWIKTNTHLLNDYFFTVKKALFWIPLSLWFLVVYARWRDYYSCNASKLYELLRNCLKLHHKRNYHRSCWLQRLENFLIRFGDLESKVKSRTTLLYPLFWVLQSEWLTSNWRCCLWTVTCCPRCPSWTWSPECPTAMTRKTRSNACKISAATSSLTSTTSSACKRCGLRASSNSLFSCCPLSTPTLLGTLPDTCPGQVTSPSAGTPSSLPTTSRSCWKTSCTLSVLWTLSVAREAQWLSFWSETASSQFSTLTHKVNSSKTLKVSSNLCKLANLTTRVWSNLLPRQNTSLKNSLRECG